MIHYDGTQFGPESVDFTSISTDKSPFDASRSELQSQYDQEQVSLFLVPCFASFWCWQLSPCRHFLLLARLFNPQPVLTFCTEAGEWERKKPHLRLRLRIFFSLCLFVKRWGSILPVYLHLEGVRAGGSAWLVYTAGRSTHHSSSLHNKACNLGWQ